MEALTIASVVIGIAGAVCAIIFGYAAFTRNKKADDSYSGKQEGVIISDIGYIKSGVDDIKRKQDTQDKLNLEIMQIATSAKDSADSAHKRIDGIEKRISE